MLKLKRVIKQSQIIKYGFINDKYYYTIRSGVNELTIWKETGEIVLILRDCETHLKDNRKLLGILYKMIKDDLVTFVSDERLLDEKEMI